MNIRSWQYKTNRTELRAPRVHVPFVHNDIEVKIERSYIHHFNYIFFVHEKSILRPRDSGPRIFCYHFFPS